MVTEVKDIVGRYEAIRDQVGASEGLCFELLLAVLMSSQGSGGQASQKVRTAQVLDKLSKAALRLAEPVQKVFPEHVGIIPQELTAHQTKLRKLLATCIETGQEIEKSAIKGELNHRLLEKLDRMASTQLRSECTTYLNELSNFTKALADSSLQQETTAVSSVIEQIGKIGTMINLIAVNASIEAARAGESGRGFGVIASEIQALSQKSKLAVEQLTARLD
jgi:hypothetical protein